MPDNIAEKFSTLEDPGIRDFMIAGAHFYPDDAVNFTMSDAGDSAGGNLAAALALKARDSGGPKLSGQVLINHGLGGDMTRGSCLTEAEAPGLSTTDVQYYLKIDRGGGRPRRGTP